MNRLLLTAMLLGLTGHALAQAATATAAPVTREQVYAELVRSKADGSYEKLHREYVDVADYVVAAQAARKVAVQPKPAFLDIPRDGTQQEQARVAVLARSADRDGRY